MTSLVISAFQALDQRAEEKLWLGIAGGSLGTRFRPRRHTKMRILVKRANNTLTEPSRRSSAVAK